MPAVPRPGVRRRVTGVGIKETGRYLPGTRGGTALTRASPEEEQKQKQKKKKRENAMIPSLRHLGACCVAAGAVAISQAAIFVPAVAHAGPVAEVGAAAPVPGHAMRELADDALQAVSGQEGASLDIELRLNTDAAGKPLASLSDCAGNNNPCKLAIAFNNRPDKWLMLKDYYGTVFIPKLYIDKTINPEAAAGSPYKELARFQKSNGDCLLGAGHAGNCTDTDIQNHPALKLYAPGATGTFEDDIRANLFVGRVAIETGATGYDNDANGTFLGLQLRDTSTSAPQARIDVDGHIAMFGF